MARGAQKTAENNANTGFVNSTQFNQNLEAGNAATQNYLMGAYKNLIANPGYDTATKSAITNTSEGAAAAAFGGAEDAVRRNAARTGNDAGVTAGLDKMAMDKAKTLSDVAGRNQIDFANAARSDVRGGLQGLSGLYGVDQNLLARSLGIPVEYLNSYINAGQMRKGGFTGAFSTAFGGALGAGLGGGLAGGAGTAASQIGSGNYGW